MPPQWLQLPSATSFASCTTSGSDQLVAILKLGNHTSFGPDRSRTGVITLQMSYILLMGHWHADEAYKGSRVQLQEKLHSQPVASYRSATPTA